MPKKEKVEFDGRVWPAILDFNVNIDAQLTSKANFLFGAATVILLFVLNQLFAPEFAQLSVQLRIPWIVLLAGSFFSALTSLMIVLPRLRFFSSKERIRDDVFYYKNIKNFFSREQYVNYLKDLPLDNKRISTAYANQVYSLATYVIPFKFKLLKISGWTLVASIFVSIVLFLALIK